MWSMGRDGSGCRVLGQEHSSLLRASESLAIPGSTFKTLPPPSSTLPAPYFSLNPGGRKDFGLLLPLKFLESWQDH